MKSYHMCMNLEVAIDMALNKPNNPYGKKGLKLIREMINREDASQIEIVEELEEMKNRGLTAIPGNGCDNHDAGHCKGHEQKSVTRELPYGKNNH